MTPSKVRSRSVRFQEHKRGELVIRTFVVVTGASEANSHWSGIARAKWECLAVLNRAYSQKFGLILQHFLRSCLKIKS